MTYNYFDASSLAEALDQSTDQRDWSSWIDLIPDDEIDFVRGKLVISFGRLDGPILPRNGRDYLREHIRYLEFQLSDWLHSSEALIDHFVISKLSAREERWWWTVEHADYWKTRGKRIDPMPLNVRLIPLCGCASFSEFEARFYAPGREKYCFGVAGMQSSDRESLLDCIESVCEYMDIAEDEVVGDLARLLRGQRVQQLLATLGITATDPVLGMLSRRIESMSSKEYKRQRLSLESQVRDMRGLNEVSDGLVTQSRTSDSLVDSWRDRTSD
jgi:hypothetical protein